MSRRVEFRLRMPNRGSWNGGWAGEGRNYVIVRTLPAARVAELVPDGMQRSYFHHWADGWTAQVSARVMRPGERAPKSDGFAGYDWMVAHIIDHGDTSDAPVPAP